MSKKGFTLIELLVVIFIIGVLAAVLLANILGARQRAEDTQRKSDLQQLKKALMMYYGENQAFPGVNNLSTIAPSFIKELPEMESYLPVADGFQAWVILENRSDKDIVKSQHRCNISNPVDGAYYVCDD